MKTSEYLDLAKKRANIASDNEFSRYVQWGKSQTNNYRHNRQGMDNDQCRKIAEILEIPTLRIIADMELIRAERKGNVEAKKAWAMLSKMTKEKGTASANLLINMAVCSGFASLYCILCKIAYTKGSHKCDGYQCIKWVS